MEHVEALYHYLSAVLATLIYGFSARKLTVISVTGTSGKTTTAHLIYHLLKTDKKRVALVSSVKAIIGDQEINTGFHVTTPTTFLMQKLISKAVKAKDQYVVIEASSHGIAQYRMLGTNTTISVLTNIAHEHLDWHKTFKAYSSAKLSLIAKSKVAIVNQDDLSFGLLKQYPKVKAQILTYSLKDKKADFSPFNLPSKSGLPGDFNEQNVLAAGAVATILGIEAEVIKKGLNTFPGVIGRFEKIDNNRGFTIIVDFAHKPNALEELLKTLRPMTNKRIIAVFGSAGERDTQKRAIMGEIAGRLSDITIITAEDPRSEDVNKIIEQIEKGLKKTKASSLPLNKTKTDSPKHYYYKIPNRKKAIDFAINQVAQKGDIVAFLGKSHEKSMCYGKTEYPWSEHEQIYQALKRK